MTQKPKSNRSVNQVERPKQIIRHPQYNDLYKRIDECIEESQLYGEPYCIHLEGPPGVGKTTLALEYAADHPPIPTDEGTEVPVFYVPTPTASTPKGMVTAMLYAIGDPGYQSGTETPMKIRLKELMKDCRVQIVIMDDFHHLIDRDTDKIIYKIADFLKTLIRETNVPFLIIGTDNQIGRILATNKQLSRHFVGEVLEPFIWDTQKKETVQAFKDLIKYATHVLEIELIPDNTDNTDGKKKHELLWKLHFATNGYMSNVMRLLRRAKRLNTDNKPIDLDLLERAYDQRVKRHIKKPNPFKKDFVPPVESDGPDDPEDPNDADATPQFPIGPKDPSPAPVDPPESVNKRGKRQKQRSPTLAEVLKTTP